MMLWPRIESASGEAIVPPALWVNISAASGKTADAPPVEMAPSPNLAPPSPDLSSAAPHPPKIKTRARLLAAFALLISTGLHAAILAFFLDRLSQAGVEATTDAVSVEIVLENPPTLAVAALGGAETEEMLTEEQDVPTETTEIAGESAEVETAQDAHPPELPEPNPPVRPAENPIEPDLPTQQPLLEKPVPPRLQETVMAVTSPRDPVAELTPPLPEQLLAEAPAPEANPPVPFPRPDYTPPVKLKPKKSKQTVAAKIKSARVKASELAGTANAKRSDRKPKNTARSTTSPAGSASANGGASPGAEAKYGQRLLSHVQRHKRYPAAAARQRITGATKLAITIDRSGKLAGAKVAAGSGHAILDEEAVAVARRAAPYPRPPDGVGGGTISFSVTLRFKR